MLACSRQQTHCKEHRSQSAEDSLFAVRSNLECGRNVGRTYVRAFKDPSNDPRPRDPGILKNSRSHFTFTDHGPRTTGTAVRQLLLISLVINQSRNQSKSSVPSCFYVFHSALRQGIDPRSSVDVVAYCTSEQEVSGDHCTRRPRVIAAIVGRREKSRASAE